MTRPAHNKGKAMKKLIAKQDIEKLGLSSGDVVPDETDRALVRRYLGRGWIALEEVKDAPKVQDKAAADKPAAKGRGSRKKGN